MIDNLPLNFRLEILYSTLDLLFKKLNQYDQWIDLLDDLSGTYDGINQSNTMRELESNKERKESRIRRSGRRSIPFQN